MPHGMQIIFFRKNTVLSHNFFRCSSSSSVIITTLKQLYTRLLRTSSNTRAAVDYLAPTIENVNSIKNLSAPEFSQNFDLKSNHLLWKVQQSVLLKLAFLVPHSKQLNKILAYWGNLISRPFWLKGVSDSKAVPTQRPFWLKGRSDSTRAQGSAQPLAH